MLEELLEAYGFSIRRAAIHSGVSPTSISRYIEGAVPSITNADKLALLFTAEDAAPLLEEWGYEALARHRESTHDPDVANGWRLDTLIAETREVKKLLQRLVHLSEPTWPAGFPKPGEEDDSTD